MTSCKCKQCGKSFKERAAFVKHLKIHTRERPSKCMTCGKNFSNKSSLVIHQQTHNERKGPFTCHKCGKMFGQRSDLLVHSKTHLPKKAKGGRNVSWVSKCTKRVKTPAGEKPYKCLECKKMFVLYRNFIKHQKAHVRDTPCNPEPAGPPVEKRGEAKEQPAAHLGLMREELRKVWENVGLLLLTQQSQLQVLQGIQKQLGVLLPGNALVNSNVYSLGLLLGQQAAALGQSSSPLLLNPSNLLPENACPFSAQMGSQSSLPERV